MSYRTLFFTLVVMILSISSLKAELLMEETITLPEYNAPQVILYLEPYLHAEGILAGDGNELYIKTTPENLKKLKEELKKIAATGKNLRISVTMNPTIVASTIKPNTNVTSTTPRDDSNRAYYVESAEGQWATIQISTRHPVRERYKTERGTIAERVIYKGVSAGFRVLPLLENGILTLKVKAAHETALIDTVVTGKLNTWINLGGVSPVTGNNSTISTKDRSGLRSHMAIKVEIADSSANVQDSGTQ